MSSSRAALVRENISDLARSPTAVREIEDEVLGAVLRDRSLAELVGGAVGAEHFSTALGERLFEAALKAARSGQPMTSVTDSVGNYEWDQPGGVDAHVARLMALPPPSMPLETAAAAIREVAIRREKTSHPYHQDVVAWSHSQAELLAKMADGPHLTPGVDWPNVIEEILSVARSEVSGVARRVELTFVHLIKAVSSPDAWSARSWRSEINLHVSAFQSDYAPSMRRLLNLDRIWASAMNEALSSLAEFGERPGRHLPKSCPLTLDELVAASSVEGLIGLFTAKLQRP